MGLVNELVLKWIVLSVFASWLVTCPAEVIGGACIYFHIIEATHGL
jgi:hypothetical protein